MPVTKKNTMLTSKHEANIGKAVAKPKGAKRRTNLTDAQLRDFGTEFLAALKSVRPASTAIVAVSNHIANACEAAMLEDVPGPVIAFLFAAQTLTKSVDFYLLDAVKTMHDHRTFKDLIHDTGPVMDAARPKETEVLQSSTSRRKPRPRQRRNGRREVSQPDQSISSRSDRLTHGSGLSVNG